MSTTIVNIKENHILTARWKSKQTVYKLSNDANWNGIANIGDEITVGTESFYVISNTNSEINALAKYNLKVGGIYNGGSLESTISPSEEGYGIQNEQMLGSISGGKKYGTVAFSNAYGWPYANNATINIKAYDGPVKDALYGTNGYENYIQKTIPTAQARLITKGELEVLGCSSTNKKCTSAPSWVYSTTYWTQSSDPSHNRFVWSVDTNAKYATSNFNYDGSCGVRPVITIPLS